MTDLSLFIVNRLGTVHAVRNGGTCTAAQMRPRKEVTALQALVYKLSPCGDARCWPSVAEFRRYIRGGVL